MNAADWQQVFTAQIRAIQSMYSDAHKALEDWAAWSRDKGPVAGSTNGLDESMTRIIWDQVPSSRADWAEVMDEIDAPDMEMKAEAAEKIPYDERRGEEVDRIIHNIDFPAAWRNVIRAAYYWRIPEYQAPRAARLNPDNFLMFLECALRRLG